MPSSIASSRDGHLEHHETERSNSDDDESDGVIDEQVAEAIRNAHRNSFPVPAGYGTTSITRIRSSASSLNSDNDVWTRPTRRIADERSNLIFSVDSLARSYRTTAPDTPRRGLRSIGSYRTSVRSRSRRGSHGRPARKGFSWTNVREAVAETQQQPQTQSSRLFDDRVWYDQFTSTDWVRDSIADAYRVKELRRRKDFRGRVLAFIDGAQGWALVAIIGCLTAGVAYLIDVTESSIFDFKTGHCSKAWYYSKRACCNRASTCDDWRTWSDLFGISPEHSQMFDFAAFVIWVVSLAMLSCLVALQTRATASSAVALSTLDENLGAERFSPSSATTTTKSREDHARQTSDAANDLYEASQRPPVVYYPAAGSGVAEVRVVLSGYVLHGYLGAKTLFYKAIGLVLAVASGMSVGKEGPFVHIATCIGNITSRLSAKYRTNDAKRRELLSASAAAGVAVAFGSPIGGVLFSLEEVSYYFPPKTLFRTFFCCIAAALSLKFLNPYGTNKIVLFEVRYNIDWKLFEMLAFVMLGVLGGALGAGFIKASRIWAKTFRRVTIIKKYPMIEVVIVAVVTGVVTFWNRYTRLPVAELLYELAAPCNAFSSHGQTLCPTYEEIPKVIRFLLIAFFTKAILTTVTFGIKVPAGIYVPSMTVGALLGRIIGHCVQLLIHRFPTSPIFASCPADGSPESCVVPGVYALVAAGATMCGVTRLSVTLAVILFELTGSLEHVLPFSIGVLTAKWTADAIEPLSIYDLLTSMNNYPFLSHTKKPVFDADIGEITAQPHPKSYIDVSNSSRVPAKQLRAKLDYMHLTGEVDGGFPVLCDGVLVGLIAGPDLEFALDRLEHEEGIQCLMRTPEQWEVRLSAAASDARDLSASVVIDEEGSEEQALLDRQRNDGDVEDLTDFRQFVDPAPVALDILSSMDLVYECFVKLGLRFICVLREGKFAGLVHKKVFVRYASQLEESTRQRYA